MFRRIFQPFVSSRSRGISSVNVSEDVSRFLQERTVVRYNGEKARRLFSDGEYNRRLAGLR